MGGGRRRSEIGTLLSAIVLVGCGPPVELDLCEAEEAEAMSLIEVAQRIVDVKTLLKEHWAKERPSFSTYRSTKLGNQITIPAAQAGGAGFRLLEANILECDPKAAFDEASWVLTLRTDADYTGFVSNPLNTLLANITLGAGATQTTFDVDVGRGTSFQVPAPNVTVNVSLPTPASLGIVPNPVAWAVPTSQVVTAAIHRGSSNAKPTRTRYFQSTGVGASTGQQPIPPLAKSFSGFGNQILVAGTTVQFFIGGPSVTPILSYTGAQINTSNNTGVPLLVPAGAGFFIIIWAAATAVNQVEALQFNLDI